MSKPKSLADWLDYQQTTHVRSVDLGLARVREVWTRMGAVRPAPVVITVGGTNGKGSTVAFLEAMLRAANLRVGCYTSPHLLSYNERVRIDGQDVGDNALVAAFERIEGARGSTPLTYFEFGTLAAFDLFARASLDVAVLEVGLGGRLDAVNLIDADAAIVTTVDLDHQDWLGTDRDTIGREKAGIFRRGKPAVVGELEPPQGLLSAARDVDAQLLRHGIAYQIQAREDGWRWVGGDAVLDLPRPTLLAPSQLANAGAAIAALQNLREHLHVPARAIAQGVSTARARARLQRFTGTPELLVDVAHNPQAARELALWLARNPARGRNLAVFGVLADKDVEGILVPLAGKFAAWFGAALDGVSARGRTAPDLQRELAAQLPQQAIQPVSVDVPSALEAAAVAAQPGDRLIAFGSFFVAAAALEWAQCRQLHTD